MFRGGGVQECVLALREGLVARGHEAFIITPQPHDFKGSPPEGIILVGGARPIRAAKTSSEVSASVNVPALTAMLERERFDILHFHEPWSPMLSMQILQKSDAINIATFHAAMSERRTSRTVEKVITPYTKSLLKYIDVMTAVSPTATNYISTLTNRRVNIIPNGIDLKKYTPGDIEKKNKYKTIFYVGRLEKRKGVKYLLQAYGILKQVHPEFRLVLAGDGPEREKLEELVRDWNLEHVEFLGFVDEPTKLHYMKEADVFCSPALYGESFGIVLLEAMASGCPVVAGNNSGYEAVLSGTGQISVVNPLDSTEFARRLAVMSTDKALRAVWYEWALQEVIQYDYDKVVDQYLRLYQAAYDKKYATA
jgi:phosphatidylinositol alpha-mannosyltransferase